MKSIVFLFCKSLFFLAIGSFAQNYGNISYAEAVNISGMQRMLSQKMSKVYMMRLNGSLVKSTEEEFKESTQLFNNNLIKLEENSINSSKKVKKLINNEKLQWEKFLNKFLLNPSNDVGELLVLANDLLDKCKLVVAEIENEAIANDKTSKKDKEKTKIVNMSGSQRMFSQRLSLYYIASKLNVGGTQLTKTQSELKSVFNELDKCLNKLSSSKLNTEEINAKFAIIKEEFNLIYANKKAFENQEIEVEKILAFSNKVTSIYNSITNLYTQL